MYARRNKLAKNMRIKNELIKNFGEVEGILQYQRLKMEKKNVR